MSDHDPDATAEQETRLRRLLAQARHGEPVPGDLAARLDRVLEQLQAEGIDPDGDRSVVDLAARRRRRVTTLLVAAAAVVVVGVGVGQVTKSSQEDSASAGSADSAVAESADAPQASGDDLARDDQLTYGSDDSTFGTFPSIPAPNGAEGSDSQSAVAPPEPLRLTEDGFAKQAVRFRDRPGVESLVSSVVPGEALSLSPSFVCDTASWGEGRLLAALYDGVPTVLAYRPVAGETQTVDLLRCGSGDVLRSSVLPVEG